MRILVVSDEYPWPARTGYRQRLSWVLRALSSHGTVDFLAVVLAEAVGSQPPPADLPLARHAMVVADVRAERRSRRLGRWVIGRDPRSLLWRDWASPRAFVADWSDKPYDLVWFSHAPAYFALADLLPEPHVVDLDNLGSSVLRHRRRSVLRFRTGGLGGYLRAGLYAAADVVDERRWRRRELQIADAGAVLVVCSELDRSRLKGANACVVPNGYERAQYTEPTRPCPPRPPGPVLIMVGLLTYEPNQDAAAFFAAQILPRVRQRCPDSQFRVVGRYHSDSAVAPLRGRVGVRVTGEVADVDAELAAADVAVVPIRFGGGTRIKILEAFAHHVPVVSTTVGCEGLDVVDGEHLLIADDPVAFASACVRLQEEEELRARLVRGAAQLWETRYRWTVLTPTIDRVVRTALGPATRQDGHPDVQADQDGPSAGSANQ